MSTECPAIAGVLTRSSFASAAILIDGAALTVDGSPVGIAGTETGGYEPKLDGQIRTPEINGRWC